jgi:hypothetical protein
VVVFSDEIIMDPELLFLSGGYDSTIPLSSRTQVLFDKNGVKLDGRAGVVEVLLADRNGNPLPAGSAVSVSDVSKKTGCEVTQTGNTVYPNTTEPAKFSATVKGCSGAYIQFEATVGDIKSSYTVQVP